MALSGAIACRRSATTEIRSPISAVNRSFIHLIYTTRMHFQTSSTQWWMSHLLKTKRGSRVSLPEAETRLACRPSIRRRSGRLGSGGLNRLAIPTTTDFLSLIIVPAIRHRSQTAWGRYLTSATKPRSGHTDLSVGIDRCCSTVCVCVNVRRLRFRHIHTKPPM